MLTPEGLPSGVRSPRNLLPLFTSISLMSKLCTWNHLRPPWCQLCRVVFEASPFTLESEESYFVFCIKIKKGYGFHILGVWLFWTQKTDMHSRQKKIYSSGHAPTFSKFWWFLDSFQLSGELHTFNFPHRLLARLTQTWWEPASWMLSTYTKHTTRRTLFRMTPGEPQWLEWFRNQTYNDLTTPNVCLQTCLAGWLLSVHVPNSDYGSINAINHRVCPFICNSYSYWFFLSAKQSLPRAKMIKSALVCPSVWKALGTQAFDLIKSSS